MKKIALIALLTATTLMAAMPSSYNGCKGCHGANGERKAMGKSALLNGMTKAEIVTALKGYKAGTLNKHGMGGLMKGQAARLSDAQMTEIANYLGK